jgi:Fibronectin type III domain
MKKRKFNIALFFHKLKAEAVLALMRNVEAKMMGNANFPDPAVKLVDLKAKADALEAAIEEATFGSRQSKLQRDQLVVESGEMLNAQADYVRSICNGDAVMLDSSGFQLAKQPSPLPLPSAPVDLKLTRSLTAGVLNFRWKKEKGVVLYYVEQQVEGSNVWTRVLSTTRVRHTFTGLITGQEYSYRVQAVAHNGVSEMSAVATQKAA